MQILSVLLCTSTSFMTGTGLKKCRPPNLSFLPVTLAISEMEREEVLLANSVVLNEGKKWREHWEEREGQRDGGKRLFTIPWSYFVQFLEECVFGLHVLYNGLYHKLTASCSFFCSQCVLDTTHCGGYKLLSSLYHIHIYIHIHTSVSSTESHVSYVQ